MKLPQKIIALLAPFNCIICSKEGELICGQCLSSVQPSQDCCYRCLVPTDGSTCPECFKEAHLTSVWARTNYQDIGKQLVRDIKFNRALNGCEQLAQSMAALPGLKVLPKDTLLVPVVTASSRKRQRGYDQAVEITKYLALLTGTAKYNVLIRRNDQRQVGASRTKRLSQLRGAFTVMRPGLVKGQHILLVDDVITTGATLEAATTALIEAGAKTVSAVVFARA